MNMNIIQLYQIVGSNQKVNNQYEKIKLKPKATGFFAKALMKSHFKLKEFQKQIKNIRHFGSSIGVGITAYNSFMMIKQCKLLKNIASTQGGGLYLTLNNNSFLFNESIILNNKAKEAGGIYLNGEYILNETNFVKTILLFNKAQNFANNLIESPTYLSLCINQREMQSQILYHNNQQKNILKLAPYLVIEQEKQYYTNYLMLPSGQSIMNYEITMPQISKTLYYIQEIGLYLKNSRNEQVQNLFNSTCLIQFDIVNNLSKNLSLQFLQQIKQKHYL